MRPWSGAIVVAGAALACRGTPGPPSAPSNRGAAPPAPGCPSDLNPLAEPPSTAAPDDACMAGTPVPLLTASAAVPTCHTFAQTAATTAHEGVTLADGRRVWMAQGGCVHDTLRFRSAPARRVDPRDRAAVIEAAAQLLRDLGPLAPDRGLARFAVELSDAARARPSGTFPIGAGDWYADVELAGDGTIDLTLDMPM